MIYSPYPSYTSLLSWFSGQSQLRLIRSYSYLSSLVYTHGASWAILFKSDRVFPVESTSLPSGGGCFSGFLILFSWISLQPVFRFIFVIALKVIILRYVSFPAKLLMSVLPSFITCRRRLSLVGSVPNFEVCQAS